MLRLSDDIVVDGRTERKLCGGNDRTKNDLRALHCPHCTLPFVDPASVSETSVPPAGRHFSDVSAACRKIVQFCSPPSAINFNQTRATACVPLVVTKHMSTQVW